MLAPLRRIPADRNHPVDWSPRRMKDEIPLRVTVGDTAGPQQLVSVGARRSATSSRSRRASVYTALRIQPKQEEREVAHAVRAELVHEPRGQPWIMYTASMATRSLKSATTTWWPANCRRRTSSRTHADAHCRRSGSRRGSGTRPSVGSASPTGPVQHPRHMHHARSQRAKTQAGWPRSAGPPRR